jgi:amidophosphoribosyltransferase
MCGISGIVGKTNVNQDIYDSLMVLQHRGQDAAGIMTCDNGRVFLRKGNGLVRDVIKANDMFHLPGNMGIGHVRYPTAGSSSIAEAQPFYVNSPYGLSIAHNGNLINSEALSRDLVEIDRRHLNTHSDSEVLLNVFAHELQRVGQATPTPENIFEAVKGVYKRCHGAYAALIMIAGFGIVGFRDPHGIRPLVYGKRASGESKSGVEYMLASESVALDVLGYELIDDVAPGEAIFISMQGACVKQQCYAHARHMPCLFEYVYLARPDSLIDKVLVYKFRMSLGQRLAEKIQKEFPNHDIDVVIPIPDSSRGAALSLAQTLGLKYREGFVKNRYIGRTFIMPGQKIRQKSIRQKLNAISLEFKDKNVLLVDDSIVRGTTSKEIVQMARDAGARKVYFASAAPEIRYPNVYGIDMPVASELVAHNHTVDEIAQKIGVNFLIFQNLSALYEAAQEGNAHLTEFEDSVFTGQYKAGNVTPVYLKALEQRRGDKQKQKHAGDVQIVEVFNGES